jgi:hypothetical protein
MTLRLMCFFIILEKCTETNWPHIATMLITIRQHKKWFDCFRYLIVKE